MPTDPRLAVVSTQQINTDWNNFLTSRGLSSQANQPISTRGILNLYNNIAAFCSVKINFSNVRNLRLQNVYSTIRWILTTQMYQVQIQTNILHMLILQSC